MVGHLLHQAEPIPDQARAELEALLQTGDLFRYHRAEDAPVTLLEQDFAKLLGVKYALAVASCSAALFLSMKALDLPKGARVLIPGFTFAAVPSSVIHAECTPVLVEVDETLRMNMSDFEAKIDDDIAAVLVSHMRGHTSDMDRIKRACEARNIPLIEDAAHSLGTIWNGQKIGTIGNVGCFSFQSYKLVNGGEGGILITNDEDIAARAVIMSGAYESNWQKHQTKNDVFGRYQNKLPLYNTRMSNLSAAVIRPQLRHVPRRAADGLTNHDYLAQKLNTSGYVKVPEALGPERRAPDSIQFNLNGFSDEDARALVEVSKTNGLPISIFGLHEGNARAFWNWQFLDEIPDLPMTQKMLMRACDVRLPAHLTQEQLDLVAALLLQSLEQAKSRKAA